MICEGCVAGDTHHATPSTQGTTASSITTTAATTAATTGTYHALSIAVNIVYV